MVWNRLMVATFVLTVVALLAACSSNHNSTTPKLVGPAAAIQTTTYQGVGVVKSTNPELPSIEIDHENIEGLMPAMRMDFHVKDRSLLKGLQANDRVEFTIENGVGGLKITAIKKLQ